MVIDTSDPHSTVERIRSSTLSSSPRPSTTAGSTPANNSRAFNRLRSRSTSPSVTAESYPPGAPVRSLTSVSGSGVSVADRNGAGYRIGVDVGGTFTDLICVTPSGDVVLDKTPSTLDDQSLGVMSGLSQLAERFGRDVGEFCRRIDLIVHGTTIADNTM